MEKMSYHKLPEDKVLQKAVIAKIKREHFVLSWHSRVCSLHLTKESFRRTPDLVNSLEVALDAELLPDAVPAIFVYSKLTSAHVVPEKRDWIQM